MDIYLKKMLEGHSHAEVCQGNFQFPSFSRQDWYATEQGEDCLPVTFPALAKARDWNKTAICYKIWLSWEPKGQVCVLLAAGLFSLCLTQILQGDHHRNVLEEISIFILSVWLEWDIVKSTLNREVKKKKKRLWKNYSSKEWGRGPVQKLV